MKNININNISSSCIKCSDPTCSKYCKLGTKIPEILKLLEAQSELEAAKLLFEGNPFPFVTGWLCDVERKCYGNCIKNKLGEPVKYYEVERYLGNKYIDLLFNNKLDLIDSKTAIIGGGICGLTIAIRLIQNGYKPTIFEKKSNLGGVLINSLPDFRYNKDNFNKVLNYIIDNSNVYYNKSFGENLFIEDLNNFDNVIVCTGAEFERKTFEESYNAVSLLENKKLLESIKGKEVVVIGGGNTAMDIARSLKLNNNVKIVYRRDLNNAPAAKSEIRSVLNEGITVLELNSPKNIVKENDIVIGLLCEKTKLYDDGSSRLNFIGTGETNFIKCDLVVEAIGSICNYDYMKKVYPNIFNDKGWIKTNDNFMTTINNLYVGGDLYYGPKDFNSAIYTGEMIVKDIISRKENMELITNKIVLIGGSFNPPTIAHEEMIKEIVKYNPKKILILPNGNKYNVSFVNKTLIDYTDRENMCKLMMKNINSDYEILDIENRQEFRGSYYTLQELNHPTFIMGSDCLESLHKWINYENLVKENNFVVFSRELDIEKMKTFLREDEFLKGYINHFDFIKLNKSDVSSSLFRKTLNKNLVNELVYDYIVSHNLYGVNYDK